MNHYCLGYGGEHCSSHYFLSFSIHCPCQFYSSSSFSSSASLSSGLSRFDLLLFLFFFLFIFFYLTFHFSSSSLPHCPSFPRASSIDHSQLFQSWTLKFFLAIVSIIIIGKYLFTFFPLLAYVRQFLIRLQKVKHCILTVFCKIDFF